MAGGDPLMQRCREAAGAVLARHGWRLVDETTLAAGAAGLLAAVPAPTQTQAERACQQIYAQTLYAAIQEPARQALAYRELHAYLYRIACRRRPELAEDAAQEAIVLLHQNARTCRDPAAFLKFAIYQLLSAFHRVTPRRLEPSLEGLLGADDEGEPAMELPDAGLAPDAEVAERQEVADLLRWLRSVIDANPRSRAQILAVVMKYLEEWDDVRIAEALDTSVANVHVLRSRGLEKLRAEYRKQPSGARFGPLLHPDR